MRESDMAVDAASTLVCKRVTVVIWALAHLAVTLVVLRALMFDGSTSITDTANCVSPGSGYSPLEPVQQQLTEQQRAHRKAALEFRRQAAPLLLILRVKAIEAEVVQTLQAQQGLEKQAVDTEHETARPAAMSILPAHEEKTCIPEANTDHGGVAVRWGLTFHVASAAECCSACAKQAAYARGSRQLTCNVWVFCGEKTGCPSPDGYHHKLGECWLKHAAPDAKRPRATVTGDYSAVTRQHSSMPVLWTSGVVPAAGPHQ